MGTLFGMGMFAMFAAFIMDKIFGSIVDSTSGAANAARYGLFTGTWTGVAVGTSIHKMSGFGKRMKKRASLVSKVAGQAKDQLDGSTSRK